MKRFKYHQTIIITDTAHPLHNQRGVVKRLRTADSGAWVAMSEDIPDALREFPSLDARRNWQVLYPEQCEVVKR